MADTPKCEVCGEPMQLMMDPEDYPKKLYAVLDPEVEHDPAEPCGIDDLLVVIDLKKAVLEAGFAENIVGEYILNKVFRVKAKIEIVEDEAGIKS